MLSIANLISIVINFANIIFIIFEYKFYILILNLPSNIIIITVFRFILTIFLI